MMNDFNTTTVLYESAETQRRSGPTWPVFVLVIAMLLIASGLGFAFMYAEQTKMADASQELQDRARALSEELAATRGALDGVESSLSETQQRLNQLGISVNSLGADVEKQQQNTINPAALSEAVLPSVVTVYCADYSQGSGFAVAVPGLPSGFSSAIITNYHVVAECADNPDAAVAVVQNDLRPNTQLAAWDEDNDLALLYVAEGFPPLAIGATPGIGQPVMSVGSPYGVDGTVAAGTVTNVQNSFLTHDAAIGPGNSGGPLIDREGRVVGVNTAIVQDSPGQNIAVRMRVGCQKILDCS